MTQEAATPNPEFAMLAESWALALRAESYSPNTLRSYLSAVRDFAAWLAADSPGAGPADVTRAHVRGWLVHTRDTRSSSTARGRYAGLRHFLRFLVEEGEIAEDPSAGVRSPAPSDPVTPVLSREQIKSLLAACAGNDFVARRDLALFMVFLDGGLRLSEAAGLRVTDVDLSERILFVTGKGARRSGPKHRAVPLGLKATRAIDRYLRERRKHPFAGSTEALWLGARGRGPLTHWAVKRALQRRAEKAGIEGLHPHMLRHSWAHEFRAAGGSEGDLMLLGGWRNRQMLDRYGKSAAADRARDAYRRLSLGDRI